MPPKVMKMGSNNFNSTCCLGINLYWEMPVNINVEEVRVRNNAWGEGECWVQLHDWGERAGGD
jgi:hypothetical protein